MPAQPIWVGFHALLNEHRDGESPERGKSDGRVVPVKPASKAVLAEAESVEERRPAEVNTASNAPRTHQWWSVRQRDRATSTGRWSGDQRRLLS